MTLLIDIDGVLLDWTGLKGQGTGFDDFVRPNVRYFNYYSPTQLKLIADSFDDIRWHTTWIDRQMVHDLWTPNTNFGPYPIAIEPLVHDEGFGFDCTPGRDGQPVCVDSSGYPDGVAQALDAAWWWKLNAVAALLHYGHLPNKVVWVDDDIARHARQVQAVLDAFDVIDRFRLVSPTQVWTRKSIEDAAAWVNES